jgi:tetratricopeptide (TPR) repeat protein
MKTKLLLLFLVVFSHFAKAQEVNCAAKEKQLSQYITDKDYTKAFEVWNEVKVSCPAFNENIYLLSSKILQYNIELAKPEDKEKSVRELIKLYNQYDKFFPDNKAGSFEKIAMALYENKAGEYVEIYSNFDKAFNLQKNTFTNPVAIFTYFNMYFDKFKSENSAVSNEKLLTKYSEVSALIEANNNQFPDKSDEYTRVTKGINSLMKDVLVSSNLIPFVQKNFEANKTNINWLEANSKLLSVSCKSDPLFEKVATELHSLKPSSKSAYYLATFNLAAGKVEKATNYYIESVSLATDKMEKAKTAYTVATILENTNKTKAKEFVLTAIENNPSNGKYFIYLASLYENSIKECASNEDEKAAIYKLASTTVLKAGEVESRLKAASETLSNQYLKKIVLDKKSKTKSVTIGCWINQTVQLR